MKKLEKIIVLSNSIFCTLGNSNHSISIGAWRSWTNLKLQIWEFWQLSILKFSGWACLGFKIEFSKSNHFCNVEHSEIQHCWKAFFNVRRILYDKSSFLSHKALSFFFSGHHHQKRIVTHFVTYFSISLCKGHMNLNSLINAIVDFSFLEIFLHYILHRHDS